MADERRIVPVGSGVTPGYSTKNGGFFSGDVDNGVLVMKRVSILAQLALLACVVKTVAQEPTWWSLRPLARPALADVDPLWCTSDIDRFVLRRLRARGLSPSPPATRSAWIRRVTVDLTGLPPTTAELAAFLDDDSSDAFAKVVDRLLASPRHGERWARHWLDVVHYADTHGFERDKMRPNAWPYRDWVIRSLNDDVTYDRFLREQLAGDVINPGDPDCVAASGFLGAGPWDFVGHAETKSPVLNRKARADELDDIVATVATSMLGLTVHCARCHDHKFDEVPQKDYYRLTAVFAGIRRGDRELRPGWAAERERRIGALRRRIRETAGEIRRLEGRGLDLAAIVGGGDGFTAGEKAVGVDPRSGERSRGKVGFLERVEVNRFVPSELPFIDGLVIPDGGVRGARRVPISSTGLVVSVGDTSGGTWDHVQSGPVASQDTTVLDGVDFDAAGHSLLGLHANKAITFDMAEMRARHEGFRKARFRATAGYGGKGKGTSADFLVFVDAELRASAYGIDHASAGVAIDVGIGRDERFLTLMATDGGDGISHDQVFFGDPRIVADRSRSSTDERTARALVALARDRDALRAQVSELPEARKVYAGVSSNPATTYVLQRGDPESPADEVRAGVPSCVDAVPGRFGDEVLSEGARRVALAEWIVDSAHPLTWRVIVNRVWHWHFGRGIVDTPSDFGRGGSRPTHPELLDVLAMTLLERGASLKDLHRRIVLSSVYRQACSGNRRGESIDGDNRLLWRMSRRRIEAEVVRDAILATSGVLELRMGGPGYRDFRYVEKYAPIYEHVTADRPELWRRSVYRFVVRSVPERFMATLDCPNPSSFTPVRRTTTTALQALVLLNNPFVISQAKLFAERVEKSVEDVDGRVDLAYRLAFARRPDDEERALASELVRAHGLFHLCRMLFNASEFLYVE